MPPGKSSNIKQCLILLVVCSKLRIQQYQFQAGIINDDIVKKMPSRGRKRFVSEGDGGLIKDTSFFW